jgi:hypothetical protein
MRFRAVFFEKIEQASFGLGLRSNSKLVLISNRESGFYTAAFQKALSTTYIG